MQTAAHKAASTRLDRVEPGLTLLLFEVWECCHLDAIADSHSESDNASDDREKGAESSEDTDRSARPRRRQRNRTLIDKIGALIRRDLEFADEPQGYSKSSYAKSVEQWHEFRQVDGYLQVDVRVLWRLDVNVKPPCAVALYEALCVLLKEPQYRDVQDCGVLDATQCARPDLIHLNFPSFASATRIVPCLIASGVFENKLRKHTLSGALCLGEGLGLAWRGNWTEETIDFVQHVAREIFAFCEATYKQKLTRRTLVQAFEAWLEDRPWRHPKLLYAPPHADGAFSDPTFVCPQAETAFDSSLASVLKAAYKLYAKERKAGGAGGQATPSDGRPVPPHVAPREQKIIELLLAVEKPSKEEVRQFEASFERIAPKGKRTVAVHQVAYFRLYVNALPACAAQCFGALLEWARTDVIHGLVRAKIWDQDSWMGRRDLIVAYFTDPQAAVDAALLLNEHHRAALRREALPGTYVAGNGLGIAWDAQHLYEKPREDSVEIERFGQTHTSRLSYAIEEFLATRGSWHSTPVAFARDFCAWFRATGLGDPHHPFDPPPVFESEGRVTQQRARHPL